MYHILVAEDSKLIMRDLSRLLRKMDAEVMIREAYDGESALEILGEFQPDIIITDIKMPMVDGLTLIQKAKGIYPQVKCVIISGYGDFEFTHEALRLQVDDYIMKPVDEKQFDNIMSRLREEIDFLKIQRQEIILEKMIQDGLEIRNPFIPGQYYLSVVRVGLVQEYAPPLSKKMLYDNMGLERNGSNYWIANTKLNNEKVVIYNRACFSEQEMLAQSECLLNSLIQKYRRVNLICSELLNDCERIGIQYEGLTKRLRKEIVLDECQVIHHLNPHDDRRNYILQKEAIDIFKKKMERILMNRSADDFRREIRKQMKIWKEKRFTVSVILKYLLAVLEELFITVGENQYPMEDPVTLADKILIANDSFEALEESLLEYTACFSGVKEEKQGISLELVQQLTEYMRQNVYNNLSLQDVAAHFEISSSYICRIFKIYYSDTPISFYNRIRIEEAKKLLEEYQNMKVKDIAELVGFSDQYYFSKVFKQQYGVSPSVYKTQLENNPE